MNKFRVVRNRGTKLRAAFEEVKKAAALLSHDPKTQVGAAIVCPESFRVLATSVNGFIAGAADDELPNLSPLKHEYMRHAERNLIGYCARKGIKMEGKILISTHSPCYECSRSLWDAGVSKIVFETEHKMTKEKFAGRLDLNYSIQKLSEYWFTEEKFYNDQDNVDYRVMYLLPVEGRVVRESLEKLARQQEKDAKEFRATIDEMRTT